MGEEPKGEGIGRGGGAPLRLLAALCLPLLLGGCGIQTVIYYDAPRVSLPSPNLIVIEHDSSNSSADYFMGYEVYYRVYQDEDKAESIGSAIYSASTSTTGSPDTLITQVTTGTLTNHSGEVFHKIAIENGVDPMPLLPWTSGVSDYSITMQESDWYYQIDSGSSVIVKRNGGDSFYEVDAGETWNSTDDDYSGETISGDRDLYLVFFVVAYGFNFTSIDTIISMPGMYYNPSYSYGVALIPAH